MKDREDVELDLLNQIIAINYYVTVEVLFNSKIHLSHLPNYLKKNVNVKMKDLESWNVDYICHLLY